MIDYFCTQIRNNYDLEKKWQKSFKALYLHYVLKNCKSIQKKVRINSLEG